MIALLLGMFGALVGCDRTAALPVESHADHEQKQASEPSPASDAEGERIRVVTYNVLVGFGDYKIGNPYYEGAERKRRLFEWLADQRPDVLSLQEMNGYTEPKLREEAVAWGHEYAVLLKLDGFSTALTSRWPIEVVDREIEGMHHGVMRCRTGGIDYVVVHLWPFDGDDDPRRANEVDAALKLVERAREEGRPVVLLGDFNALSNEDVPHLTETAYAELKRWKWELANHTAMIQRVSEAGLYDPVPTYWPESAEMDEPRVDFIFLGPGLTPAVTDARWVYSLEMIKWSDHLPVVVDLLVPAESLDR